MDERLMLRIAVQAFAYATLVGWAGTVVLAIVLMHRRIAALERARPGSAGMFGSVVPLGYAISLPWWFVALPLGVYWLWRRPELARQGRISVLATLAMMTLQIGALALGLLEWAEP